MEPNLPITYLQLGTALTSSENYEKAVPVLRKAVEMRPDLTVPRYQLGSALFETGDLPGAIGAARDRRRPLSGLAGSPLLSRDRLCAGRPPARRHPRIREGD